jgi:hypothetical protein
MIKKRILNTERIRRIQSGFAFIEHRFLTGGFLASLSRAELLLYFFLVLAADRNGISFYCYDSICNLVGLDLSEYLEARGGLIAKDLICFKDNLFQVLSLPVEPALSCRQTEDGATVRHLIMQSLKEAHP